MFAPGMFVNPAGTTPEDIARKRAEIAAMMPSFGNARYVGEGLGQLFAGIGLGRQQAALDKQEQAGRQSADERLRSVMGMRGTAQPGSFTVLGPMPATPAQSVADDAMAALGKTPMRPYRDAIASIESAGSGDYSAVGPTHPTMGRALGRYQVMEANIGPWSKEALGREVTPEEFLANPQLQDAIFDHKFGGYVQQYGPEGAAQAWFAGPGGVGKMDRRDSLGTSVADYTQKFSGALGNSPQTMAATIPVQDLMALATDPWQPAEVRQQAQAMLDQQQQLNDPAYAMGLERDRLAIQKTQAELDAMRNPAPAPLPADVIELQWRAENAGLQPGTPEYQDFIRTGGNGPLVDFSGANIGGAGEVGTIPQGYELFTDSTTGARSMRPIQGGPEDTTKKDAAAENAALTASSVVTTAANRALEAARARNFDGFGQGLAQMLPWTDSAEVARQVGVLGSQATIETLTAMREASPTGGALGSVTERELGILQQKSGALDPSSPNFERDLADYTLTLLETIHGVDAGRAVFRQTWKGVAPERLTQDDTPKSTAAPVTVTNDAEYEALPSGSIFVGPDGKTRRKP